MALGPARPVRARLLPPAAALLIAATACSSSVEAPPAARTAPRDAAGDRIGTLSLGTAQGPRACTASVVRSPRHNLLVTAAHCVVPEDYGPQEGLVFTPGYRNGTSPYGSWALDAVTVDPRWSEEADPEYDVAFVTVKPSGGRQIEDVVGGNSLGGESGFGLAVSVTGYPNGGEEPITCSTRTASQSPTQERFDCDGYTEGTSGSPWITGAGAVVGVIGGYQEGGDTPRVSYSVTFDERVTQLYRRAAAG